MPKTSNKAAETRNNALTKKERWQIKTLVWKLQGMSPEGKLIDVQQCLKPAKKIVQPASRYKKHLEAIKTIAKNEAVFFTGYKPHQKVTVDKNEQEHAEIVAGLQALLNLQQEKISKYFVRMPEGYLKLKEEFQFTNEQLATDDRKLLDAVNFFLETGMIPIRLDNVDVEGFYKYLWMLMTHMPYDEKYGIKLTDKMRRPQRKYFKTIEEVNPLTNKPMKFLVLNTDRDTDGQPICGRELDAKNPADWAIIFEILTGPINGVLQEYLEKHGPWHLDFGAPQDSGSVGGPPAGEGNLHANLQRAVAASMGIIRFLYFLVGSRFTLAESQRTILKYAGRGMPKLAHVDESMKSMLAKAEAMKKLAQEHPEMSLENIFLEMIRTHEHIIDLQGKAVIKKGGMKMVLCGHLFPDLFARIAKYQNKTKSGNGSKTNFMSAKGDTEIDKLLKQLMQNVLVFGGNYWIGFWGPHGHGANKDKKIQVGKFVGAQLRPGGHLSDEEIAQRMEYLLHGTQSKKHPSGDLKCLLPAQASISPPYLGGLIARIPEKYRHLIYHAEDKSGNLRYFKSGDPIWSVGDYSPCTMPPGSYFPANRNDRDRFIPATKLERMVLGLETMDPEVMRAQIALPVAQTGTGSV